MQLLHQAEGLFGSYLDSVKVVECPAVPCDDDQCVVVTRGVELLDAANNCVGAALCWLSIVDRKAFTICANAFCRFLRFQLFVQCSHVCASRCIAACRAACRAASKPNRVRVCRVT